MKVIEPDLVLFYCSVAIPQVRSPGPKRFDLRSSQHNSCFYGRLNGIVMEGFLIGTDNFLGHRYLFLHALVNGSCANRDAIVKSLASCNRA